MTTVHVLRGPVASRVRSRSSTLRTTDTSTPCWRRTWATARAPLCPVSSGSSGAPGQAWPGDEHDEQPERHACGHHQDAEAHDRASTAAG